MTPTDLLQTDLIPNYDDSSIIESLQDGIAIFEALNLMDSNLFEKTKIGYDDDDSF